MLIDDYASCLSYYTIFLRGLQLCAISQECPDKKAAAVPAFSIPFEKLFIQTKAIG